MRKNIILLKGGRNETWNKPSGPGTEIRDQTLSAEYGVLNIYKTNTCMYQAEIYVKCRLLTLLINAYHDLLSFFFIYFSQIQ